MEGDTLAVDVDRSIDDLYEDIDALVHLDPPSWHRERFVALLADRGVTCPEQVEGYFTGWSQRLRTRRTRIAAEFVAAMSPEELAELFEED